MREGARADVYAAASPRYPGLDSFDEGIVDSPVVFATNRLVIVVPSENPAESARWTTSQRADVRLVVGGEGVPIGDYTRESSSALGGSTSSNAWSAKRKT